MKNSTLLLKMKLTIILLLVAMMQVQARGYSQMITLKQQNAQLEEVFVEIMKQTNSKFVYSSTMLKEANPVNINLTNVTLEEALDLCFQGQPLTYIIDDDNTVIVKMKELPPPPVNGKVLDEKGNPLPFVNIRIKGTTKGVACDAEGNFSIDAKIGDILVISFLGYESKEVTLKSLTSITISLKVSISNLDEVVLMGYTTKKASELTGSVQTVTANELSRSITTPDAIAALKGRVTGVNIVNSSPFTAVKATMTVTGQGTFSGGVDPISGAFNDASFVQNSPLIVIDGVITQYTSIAQAVSIADIATITLMKDAASNAIYGSRAAAGVILVTTKKGTDGKPKVQVTLTSGINYPNYGNIDFMNTSQWLQTSRDAAAISWAQIPSYQTQFPNGYKDLWKNKMEGMNLFDTTYTFDWQKNTITPGILKNATVNLSGGNATSNYYVGFSTYNESGNDLVSKYAQNSLRVKLEHKFNKFLTVGMNLSGMFEDQKNPATTGESNMTKLPFYNPHIERRTSDSVTLNTWRGPGTSAAAGVDRRTANPFYDAKYNDQLVKNTNLMGSFWGKINFTPWLSFTSTNTWSHFRDYTNAIIDRRTVGGGFGQVQNTKGRLEIATIDNYVFLTSNQFNFRKTFNENHNINILAGQEYQSKLLLTTSATKLDVMAGERNLGAGATDTYSTSHMMPSGNEREYLVYSLFGQANYDFNGIYLFTASIRRDASASYSREGRYKNFWSLSGGWAVSREKFWEPLRDVVSFLKIRGSYGVSGKDAGSDFLNQTLYSRSNRGDYLDKGTLGYYLAQVGNEKLTWETTNVTEAGIDIELFKGRVSANFSTYNKAGKNLLLKAQYSSTSGIPAQYQNVGDLTNKGWELALKTINVKHKDFSWSTSFNMYHNTNRIDKIRPPASSDDVPMLPLNSTYMTYGYSGNYVVGESLNDVKKVKFLRFEPSTGYPVFEHISDTDGSKSEVIITPTSSFSNLLGNAASLQKIGTAVPKVQGGLINEFRYKNFGMSILITYGFGSMVLSRAINGTVTPYGTLWTSYNQIVLNPNQIYWKPGSPDNDKANVPGPGFQFASINSQTSSMNWIKGDAVKIANIRLSYDLPLKILEKLKISSFQIVLSADNLKYFTNKYYLGSDPEAVTYQGSGNDTGGLGRLNYNYGYAASPRRVNLTFNIGF